MKTFPMFLKMDNRRVVIIGDGEAAAQKARLMLKTEARIELFAQQPDPELLGLIRAGRVHLYSGPIGVAHLKGAQLVFIGTGCAGADAALQAIAREAGVLVNVVDRPELCEAITPAIVDRDPVVIAIGTEGTAPMLAREIRARIEEMLEPRLGGFAALAGRLRGAVAMRLPKREHRAFWAWVFTGAPRQLHAAGEEQAAAAMVKAALSGGVLPQTRGSISLVGAGPGVADLLTLRAHQRLQDADIIFYDRLVSDEVLDLARRDAERVYVGKAVGANAWPQDRINGVIVAAARQGKRVVRLKSGDPGIFGRACEEIAAAAAYGIPVEIIPGVTAATAAAAAIGRPLTDRGQTDRVVMATATCRPGDPMPDLAGMLAPGTTLALYMAMGQLELVQAELLTAGLAASTPVDIVASAACPEQQHLVTSLGALCTDVAQSGIGNPAILFIRRNKSAAVQALAASA